MNWTEGRRYQPIPDAATALPGRSEPMLIAGRHAVLDTPLAPSYAENLREGLFGMGCFWGVERLFWQLPGVRTTAVGYAAGLTPNPTYQEVCTGLTGHNEVVRVVYDPAALDYETLLKTFWENHDPTQGMRQGNDVGAQYRSGIYVYDDSQRREAEDSMARYQEGLRAAGFGGITTEILDAPSFYYAEEYHQQYLAKNPGGYCGLGGTGVCLPSRQG